MFSVRSALVALASLALIAASPVEKRQSAGGLHNGHASFYSVGLGVCGQFSQPSDFVTAVSPEVFNAFPGATPGQTFGNPICGRQATVTYKGKSITVSILDSCPTQGDIVGKIRSIRILFCFRCPLGPTCGFNDIDLSTGAFKALRGDLKVGLVDVTWMINGL